MKFEILDAQTADFGDLDLVFAGIFASDGEQKSKEIELFKAPKELSGLGKPFLSQLMSFAQIEGFAAAFGQSVLVRTLTPEGPRMVALMGLGKPSAFENNCYRKLGGIVYKLANDKRGKKIALFLPESKNVDDKDAIQSTLEGFQLACYRFDKYFTENKPQVYVEDFRLVLSDIKRKGVKDAVHQAAAISSSVCLARDLVNEGANVITPVELAQIALKEGKAAGIDVEVLDEARLAKENMNLILAVAKASMSVAPPRLIRLAYRPKKKAKKHIILVGKGITFDSGGLDLKPADGMRDMKIDMAGSAAVLATLLAIGKLQPDVAVTGYMVCVENGIGSKAYHPGDVIKSRKGLTIEIDNTDAEGRLVLADALDYAQSRDKADVIIDIATLTGACMIALGASTAAIFSDDDKLAKNLYESGKKVGEDFWRLPLNEDLRDQLKSSVADMKNSGGRMGGSITAGLFLKKFIGEKIDWAHLDVAGPVTMEKDHAYNPKGATGFAVRTLVDFICN